MVMRPVLPYWRNSVADASRMTIDGNRLQQAIAIEEELELASGQLPQNVAGKLFELQEKGSKKNDVSADAQDGVRNLSILISPFLIIPSVEHGELHKNRNPMPVHPLWVPALLDSTGMLVPPNPIRTVDHQVRA
jgi:hypothetical protein